MEYKYDAFISYRHAEKDTKIASEIQQSLERFRIPTALRKKTGKERFNRIFRDVEELPISSNLTEDLTEALRESEFLIVICSYRTSESDWVKREIDTFLELHDYNKQLVLTVLVEGEPDEVIPEVLRHDNIIHYLADGTFYCKDEMVEPLAADYRMPIRKARKIELPRLAASMLGCNYDDIIRRRKAFKRRRLLIETAVISVAAVALIVYIGWMLMKIQENLKNAQMNQSRYLATESVKMLEDGDRINALQLALAALENTDGSRRPVTSEAERALSLALGAYNTWGSSVASPVWRYELSSAIVKFGSDTNADHIAVLDTAGKLHVWDRKEHKETLFISDSPHLLDFVYDKNDNLIVMGIGYVALYDSATMAEKWRFEEKTITAARDVTMVYYPEKEYVAVNASDSLYILNAADGKKVMEILTDEIQIFKDKRGETHLFFSMSRFMINSDFSKIALAGGYGIRNYCMYVYDVKNNSWTCVIEDSGDFLDATFDNDGNLLVLRHPKGDTITEENYENNALYETTVVLEMISPQGKSLWKNEFSTTTRAINTALLTAECVLSDKTKTNVVTASFANHFVIIDKKTGKTVRNVGFPGSIISTGLRHIEGIYYADIVTQSGTAYFLPVYEGYKTISSRKYFPDGTIKLKGFKINDVNSYLVEDASKRVITEYSGRFSDKKFIGFAGTEDMPIINLTSKNKAGDYILYFGDKNKISGVDVKNNKGLWTKDFPECKTLVSYDAYTPDNKYAYLLKEVSGDKPTYTCSLIRVNCLTGEFEDVNNEFTFSGLIATQSNGNQIFAVSDEQGNADKFTLYSYDVATDKVSTVTINTKELGAFSYIYENLGVSPDGKKVIVYLQKTVEKQTKTIRLIIDAETGKFTTSDCGYCQTVVWNDLGTLFAEMNEEGNITVSSTDGKEKYKIDTEMRTPLGMEFYENKLYVVYNVDVLCSYDSIGKQIMSIELKHGDIDTKEKARFEFVRQTLFVTAGGYTDVINILDKKSIGSFSGFICLYNKAEAESTKDISKVKIVSSTFTTEKGICRIGWFEYKTVPKMIEEAKEYLKENGVKMSEEFRRKYGIE